MTPIEQCICADESEHFCAGGSVKGGGGEQVPEVVTLDKMDEHRWAAFEIAARFIRACQQPSFRA